MTGDTDGTDLSKAGCTSLAAVTGNLDAGRDVIGALAPVARAAEQLDVRHGIGTTFTPRNDVVEVQVRRRAVLAAPAAVPGSDSDLDVLGDGPWCSARQLEPGRLGPRTASPTEPGARAGRAASLCPGRLQKKSSSQVDLACPSAGSDAVPSWPRRGRSREVVWSRDVKWDAIWRSAP